ncbi:hypothetical protein FS815_16855 [Agrobacterium vitis]|nr:hypothetical protein [Allorhizobium ampelinum]
MVLLRLVVMSESENQAFLQDSLQVLVGLPLSIARNAADMKVFHFGSIRPHHSTRGRPGTTGSHALHIQCSWRIVTENRIVTGSSDRFMEPEEGAPVTVEDPQFGTLQFVRIAALLQGYDEATKSFVNATDHLIVQSVTCDRYCGADLQLSGGYRLQIFPDGSQAEDWRFMENEGRHIVIEGGKVNVVG